MNWRALAIGVATALCLAQALPAQQVPAAFEPSRNNLQRLRWLDYRLVAGRVIVTSSYAEGMDVSYGPAIVAGKLREHLRLVIHKDRASVRFTLAGDEESLEIAAGQMGDFSLIRRRTNPRFELVYRQLPGRPLLLSIEDDQGTLRRAGESFWHLYLAEPEAVTRHLIPLLELMRPTWQLAATGKAIEDALFTRARNPQALDTERWLKLVERLASDKFADREEAQRELARVGQVLLPFLQGLDHSRLDAEQTSRVASLVASLAVEYEDSPDRIAAWLSIEPRAWLALLNRPEPAKRTLAAARMAMLVDAPVEFDPDAEPARRTAQLAPLEAQYGLPWVELPEEATADSVPPPGLKR